MKWMRIALVLTCITAVPMFAADRTFDLTGWAAWVDPNSSGTFNAPAPNQPFNVNFNGKLGYGIGANIFFGSNVSAAFDIVQVRPEATLRPRPVGGGGAFTNGFRMTPLTGVLQWHFAPSGFIDPYVGAGAAYVLFERANVFGTPNLNRIDFKDDVGLAVNGGLSLRLTRMLALTADGKYVPLKSSAKAVFTNGTATTKVKINPVIFSGGLSLRF
jgi:outer membrane protein W